jgi:hypothetical protein
VIAQGCGAPLFSLVLEMRVAASYLLGGRMARAMHRAAHAPDFAFSKGAAFPTGGLGDPIPNLAGGCRHAESAKRTSLCYLGERTFKKRRRAFHHAYRHDELFYSEDLIAFCSENLIAEYAVHRYPDSELTSDTPTESRCLSGHRHLFSLLHR